MYEKSNFKRRCEEEREAGDRQRLHRAAVPEDARAALTKLRKTIKAAAPKATEVISYQIPTFKHHGPLVAFAAFKNHCGFYIMSTSVREAHKDELKSYDTAKATIRFPANKPAARRAREEARQGAHRGE